MPAPLDRADLPLRVALARIAVDPGAVAAILEASPEAMLAFDARRRIVAANRVAEVLLGAGRHGLDGLSTDDLIPARIRQPAPAPMAAMPEIMRVDLPGLRRDGTELAVEWVFGSVELAAGLLFVLVVRDHAVSERAVEALQASEQRFRLLVEGVRDYAIYMLDASGHVSSWNPGAERNKGWAADEIIGQSYAVFFTPEDRAVGLPEHQLARALAEDSIEVTGWRVRKDGTRFRANASLSALRTATGEHYGFAKITRDLTDKLMAEEVERKLAIERAGREAAEAAEQRLREGEDRIRRLQWMTAALSQAATPVDVAAVVLEQSLGAIGAAAGLLYGLGDDERTFTLLDHRGYSTDLVRGFETLALDARLPMTDAPRAREAAFYESRMHTEAAYPALASVLAELPHEAAAVLPLITHGKLLGVLGISFATPRRFEPSERSLLLTVSELCAQALDRARLFAAETAARAAAEAANRSKDEFLAMLGHELRNPLAPIVTALSLIEQRGGDELERAREVIARQVTHLVRLVDDLLDVSRITQKKVHLKRERIELAAIVDRSLELCNPILDERHHHLAVDVAPQGLVVFGDATRLAQVVTNLVTNAAKYTPPGGHIAIAAHRRDARIVLTVADDGTGIAAEMLPHVFDLFAQEHQSLDRSRGGLGLGLAIVKSLVAMHDGAIAAASDGHGKGSVFTLELPAASADDVATATEAATASKAAETGRRVLVVDDNVDAAELMADVLRLDGHEVITAHDGPAALTLVRTFRADIALLDIGLPVMDGYELARRLREQLGVVRLVALTGYGQADDRERARVAGFDLHMVKPVDLASLRAALLS